MHDEVDYRKHLNSYQGQKGNRKYYPIVTVGAKLCGQTAIGCHRYHSTLGDFHALISKILDERLGQLNHVGRNYPQCQNLVGHCAENYAASGVLRKIDPQESIADEDYLSYMNFTKAFMPRTWRNVDWCANCHTMYD